MDCGAARPILAAAAPAALLLSMWIVMALLLLLFLLLPPLLPPLSKAARGEGEGVPAEGREDATDEGAPDEEKECVYSDAKKIELPSSSVLSSVASGSAITNDLEGMPPPASLIVLGAGATWGRTTVKISCDSTTPRPTLESLTIMFCSITCSRLGRQR